MNLNHYIIISILAHLLLTGLITATHSFTGTRAQVFDVKIVPPLEAEEPATVEPPKPETRKEKPVLLKKSRRKPEESTLEPDTLYSGTGTSAQGGETPESRDSAVKTGETDTAKKEEKSPSHADKDKGSGLPESEETSLVPGFSLFDKKTIEKFASKAPPADRGLTFDTSEFKHRAYMRMLKERIESIWKYPREAEKLGLSGDLYIKFSIKKNGELGEIELVRTSGYRELDRAAINALKKAFPWWPLPKDYKENKLTITGHFIYIFGSTYIL